MNKLPRLTDDLKYDLGECERKDTTITTTAQLPHSILVDSKNMTTTEKTTVTSDLPNTKDPTNFEEILNHLGGFGLFQFISLVLLLFLEIPAAFVSFIPVFVGTHTGTWYCGNSTDVEYSFTEICACQDKITASPNSHNAESIVSEWNLVCKAGWVSDFITSGQMLAMFLGNLIACKLSDWYGRRYTFIGVSILMGVGQGLSAVAIDPYTYAITRFISGMGVSGYLGVASVYAIEFQPPKWRPLCGSVGPWGEAVMLLALMAYYVRPWRILTGFTTLPYLLLVIIIPFLPESPRWLLRNKKISEAHQVLGYMAKLNRKPNIDLQTLQQIADKESPPSDPNTTDGVKQFGYIDFFRDESLRWGTIFQIIIMASTAITYYGISFNVKNMEGSPYIIVMLLGLSDSIGYPSALLICNRLGRRTSLALYMTIGALFLVTLAVLELSIGLAGVPTVVIVLCLLGKFCVAGGRSCARTLVGELYPTAVRGMGSGLGGMGAAMGGVVAPQLAFLGSHYPSVPYFVFGFIGIVGALFSFLLTETVGKPLTDQVQELSDESHRLTIRRQTVVDSIHRLSINRISFRSKQTPP